MSHAELMGRPRIATPNAGPRPPPSRRGQNAGSSSTSLDGHGGTRSSSGTKSNDTLAPPLRPGVGLRRVSSFSGPAPGGNRAGVGAVYNDLPAQSLPVRRAGRRGSLISPTPPPPVRRMSSYDESTPTGPSGSVVSSASSGLTPTATRPRLTHQRTASDSTISTRTITRPIAPPVQRDQMSPPDGSIRLGMGRPDQAAEIGKLVNALHTLTPPNRVRIHPSPHASILHPSSILTPFAVTLEALVVERTTLLTPDQPTSELPDLKDGTSLKLAPPAGSGEIDWSALQRYIRALGVSLDRLLPYIQTSPDQAALEDLIRSIRMFVGKIKKVFSEVLQGYGDQYGFMKGLWDDQNMKACAGEIGRWCDLFDA